MNTDIDIVEVESKAQLREFILFYPRLYRSCPQAVPYLFIDEKAQLSKNANSSFECCEARYFLALRNGQTVGRIAAIINHRANEQWHRRQLRFGWFDFIDDTSVSKALLDAAIQWGREQGMTEVCGPMGFIDTDREGMLIEGFDEPSTMYVNYNYPYYLRHLEHYGGFGKDNDYLEYLVRVPEQIPDKFARLADMVGQRYGLRAMHFTKRQLMQKRQGERVFRIINQTYAELYGYSQLSHRQIQQLVREYITWADMRLVVGVIDTTQPDPEGVLQGNLVGFGITFPSLADALRKTGDGRLLPFGWLHLVKALYMKHPKRVDLLLIGVLPQYRAKGANSLIFNELIQQFQQMGFEWAEAMPQMESNTHVRSQWQYLDSHINRRHRVFKREI
ncbi:MAG: N-acetyltransferase [Prevotella sp.]|nr:N-acetyltransferase [Prevotella sp.]